MGGPSQTGRRLESSPEELSLELQSFEEWLSRNKEWISIELAVL